MEKSAVAFRRTAAQEAIFRIGDKPPESRDFHLDCGYKPYNYCYGPSSSMRLNPNKIPGADGWQVDEFSFRQLPNDFSL